MALLQVIFKAGILALAILSAVTITAAARNLPVRPIPPLNRFHLDVTREELRVETNCLNLDRNGNGYLSRVQGHNRCWLRDIFYTECSNNTYTQGTHYPDRFKALYPWQPYPWSDDDKFETSAPTDYDLGQYWELLSVNLYAKPHVNSKFAEGFVNIAFGDIHGLEALPNDDATNCEPFPDWASRPFPANNQDHVYYYKKSDTPSGYEPIRGIHFIMTRNGTIDVRVSFE